MKKFAIAVTTLALALGAGTAFAQASDAMSGGAMAKDSMSKDSMSKDSMSKDKMAKHNKMKKGGDAMGMKHEASGAMSN